MDRQALAARVQKLREKLPAGADENLSQRVEDAGVAAVSAATNHEADAAMARLNALVGEASRSARRRVEDEQEATALIRRLDGLRGAEVSRLRKVLEQVVQGKQALTSDLHARVEEIGAAAAREADRQYVAQVFTEALRRLNYEVGEEFQTLATGAQAIYRNSKSQDYGVRVRLAEDKATLDLEVVRLRNDGNRSTREQALLDTAAEEAFCQDHDALIASSRDAGVTIKVMKRLRAGERPMPVIAVERADADVRRQARAPRARGFGEAP